jgi:hypothetical protein
VLAGRRWSLVFPIQIGLVPPFFVAVGVPGQGDWRRTRGTLGRPPRGGRLASALIGASTSLRRAFPRVPLNYVYSELFLHDFLLL